MIQLPHLETNITTSCQNCCVGCNHFIPMQQPSFLSPEVIAKDLNKLSKLAHAKRYALLGGEPLLHPNIVKILNTAKKSGIADKVEVITNGMKLKDMTEPFWKAVDYLTVTMYPGKLSDEDMQLIYDKTAENGITLELKPAEFTALMHKHPSDTDTAMRRYIHCWYKTYCFVVDNGYFYRCCTSPFIPELILGMPKETDGIALEELTEAQLDHFINQTESIPVSCKVCASNTGREIGWRETTRGQWLDESKI